MARKFIGSNTDKSSRRTWYYRAKFETKAYTQPNAGENEIKDITFFERQYYGTIDELDYPIVPKEDLIIGLAGGKRALPFVVDAFTIFKKRMTKAVEYNKITTTNPFFVNFTPTLAYQSPLRQYKDYLGRKLQQYNLNYIENTVGYKSITSFEDYVKFFVEKIKQEGDSIYSLSKWCRSPECSVYNSGLGISIDNLDFGEDQPKMEQFIDHQDFNHYLKLALNSGFSISKDNPGTLIFDLLSPAAAPFLAPYRLRTLRDIFSQYYDRTELREFIYIRNIINRYYNLFIIQNKIIRTNKIACNKSYTEYEIREAQTLEDLDLNYPEDWFLDYYIDLRNYEEGSPFNPHYIKSMKKIAKKRLKKLDINESLSYISKTFRDQTWSKPYGFDDFLKNQNQVIDDDIRPPTPRGGTGGY